jgi:hypothetical protein
MRLRIYKAAPFALLSVLLTFASCDNSKRSTDENKEPDLKTLSIGWASENITPDKPVLIHGQFHARISEGIMDPVMATALALESVRNGTSGKVILISCDLVFISRDLLEAVRSRIHKSFPEIAPDEIIVNGTHTHTGPAFAASREVINEFAPGFSSTSDIKSICGIQLDAMEFAECRDFLAGKIASAAGKAWKSRRHGGISYGLGQAVVGHNRLASYNSGKSVMYGKTDVADFSNIEGYEDHSVNLLYTWDINRNLTGVVINVACPSQVSESAFRISADYWHDTRVEVRKRFGEDVFILPQCSAAGDQSPHLMWGAEGEERMQRLMFPDSINTGRGSMGRRKQIAVYIADAITSVFPYAKGNIEWTPYFRHTVQTVELSRRILSKEDVDREMAEALEWKKQYEKLLYEIENNPGIRNKPRWYVNVTSANRRMLRGYGVKERYDLLKTQPKMPVEIHTVRIGDIAFATNPFELYLDYGIRIKAHSAAVQTFLVQLCGHGSYVPSARAVAGGSYGAIPASTLVGPEGGEELVVATLDMIRSLWQEKD